MPQWHRVSREDVLDAVREFDQLGRAAFLHKYGFGRAHRYFLVVHDGQYDSKAILAAAYERATGEARLEGL